MMIRRAALLSVLGLLLLAGCAQPAQKAPAPRLPIPAAPPRGEPDVFANISGDQLRVLLGSPGFIRKDGAAEMWRYDGASCHAYFFLYGTPQMVRHAETLPVGVGTAADPACLNALRAGPKLP